MSGSLPYFDYLLSAFGNGLEPLEKTFGHHVHWGYWEFPEQADQTQDDFFAAAENLSRLIYETAQAKDGQVVLDVGCGFGGTLSSINDRFQDMDLVGLNIDDRQLERARRCVTPTGTNRIRFRQGDACALPFADNTFDIVLAVECIFHFPSREQFFREACRVLKPGGHLALSDFSLGRKYAGFHDLLIFRYLTSGFFGSCNVKFTREMYAELAVQSGFTVDSAMDITKNTLPTYTFIKSLLGSSQLFKLYGMKIPVLAFTIRCIEQLSRMNVLKYYIYSFRKPLS